MITVKRGKLTFYFVFRDPVRGGNQVPVKEKGQIQRKLWFGVNLFAEAFLHNLSADRNAGTAMSSLLSTLGGQRRVNVPASQWIKELAPRLVSGEVQVTEVQPKGPGGEGTKSKKGGEAPLVVPRKAPVVERTDAPDAATFPSLNEDAQAGALIAASQAGAAFCEVCSKA